MGFEQIIALLEVAPVAGPGIARLAGQRLLGEPEGEGMHVDGRLPRQERRLNHGIDLVDLLVGNGIAADRGAAAMHHQRRAGPPQLAVIGVGKAQVERQVVTGIGIELAQPDPIKAFRRLPVAFAQLGAEAARELADLIAGKQRIAPVLSLQPDFEPLLGLEDTDMNRIAQREAALRQLRDKRTAVEMAGWAADGALRAG